MANAQTPIDLKKLPYRRDFRPRLETMTLLDDRGNKFIAMFDGEWNNRAVFNIRELYEQFGEWGPGKGIMVPIEQKPDLLQKIVNYAASLGITAK